MSKNSSFKRTLNLKDIVFLAMGVILGAGIYAIVGEAAGSAGNLLWLSFILAGVVAMLTALSYAEFVSRFPDAGGSYEFMRQAFGSKIALVFGVATLFTGVVGCAAISISFAGYLSRLWDLPVLWFSIAIIIVLSGVNILGIRQSSWLNIVATIITLLGLLFVVLVSLPHWGDADLLEKGPEGFGGVLAAGALTFFAYVGFEDVVKTSEETKDPRRTVTRGILLAGLLVMVIYLLISVSIVNLRPWESLAGSASPLADAVEQEVGKFGTTALVIVALFATSNSILTNILGSSRLIYDVSRDEDITWMKRLSHVPEKLSTPVYAILTVAALAICFALIQDLKVVASISNLFLFVVFLLVNGALITWRLRNQDADRAVFHLPLNVGGVPLTAVLAIIGLLIFFYFNLQNVI